MSTVTVRFFGGAAEAFGTSELELANVTTLSQLIESLSDDGRQLSDVLDQCSFFVDGEHHRDRDTPLTEGCRVDVLPPFAGG